MCADAAIEKEKFKEKVRDLFSTLKSLERYDELLDASIRMPNNAGYLLCVSNLHESDDQVISLLSKWREEATTFHNKFKVTHKGTRHWLKVLLLDVPDRILFLVLDSHGYPIGHLGFANAINDECVFELDNVVRGVNDRSPGIMSAATVAILQWARENASPKQFYLRTLDDNIHAIRFYEKLGARRGPEADELLYGQPVKTFTMTWHDLPKLAGLSVATKA